MDLLLKQVIKKFEEDLLRDHVKNTASGYSSKVGKLLASYINETGSNLAKSLTVKGLLTIAGSMTTRGE